MIDENEMLHKKEMIEEKLLKAKIKRESCRKNKMRVLQELDSQKHNKLQMVKEKTEKEKSMLMDKISSDINVHEARRMEQVQKVQMKAQNEWQKVEKAKSSPNKEN